ncbi:MAG: hypothetical protein AAGF72_02085 [Pseudomonadota bacterium]
MNSKDTHADDDLAQQRAEAGERQSPVEREYGALFSVLDRMRAPEPDPSVTALVVARTAAERTRRKRERRLLQGLVVGLFALLAGYGGAATVRVLGSLGEGQGLAVFSVLVVTAVGLLSGWLSGRQTTVEHPTA